MTHRKGRAPMSRSNGFSEETKIALLSEKFTTFIASFEEFKTETRKWRDDFKVDIQDLKIHETGRSAVENYKRWALGSVLLAAVSVIVNIIGFTAKYASVIEKLNK